MFSVTQRYCYISQTTQQVSPPIKMSEQQTLTDNMKLAPPVKTSFVFDIDYRKMYHNVRRCNDVVLHKLDKAQRSADYWKREHKLLIDTLWGWTTYQVKSKKPLHTPYPVKQKSKKKKPRRRRSRFLRSRHSKTSHKLRLHPSRQKTKLQIRLQKLQRGKLKLLTSTKRKTLCAKGALARDSTLFKVSSIKAIFFL